MSTRQLLLSLMVITAACFARAGELSEKAQDVARTLRRSENRLSADQARSISDKLDQILDLIDGVASTKFLCIPHKDSFGRESFGIYNPATNRSLGATTSKDDCQSLIAVQNAGLVCVPKTDSFGRYSYLPTEVSSEDGQGADLDKNTCLQLIQRAQPDFMCIAHFDSFRRVSFYLYNRLTKSTIGADTNLDNCLSSMP